MKKRCATCPFRTDSKGQHPHPELVAKIQQRCLNKVSQICHHPRNCDKPETHLCRGARDFQLEIFHHLGVIAAPTDDAWREAAVGKKIRKK